jgi:hypothetical protein
MMMDLMERIAGLPQIPEPLTSYLKDRHAVEIWDYDVQRIRALMARLALYNELAQARDGRLVGHLDKCGSYSAWACNCGRDALLAALEVPRG